MTKHIKTDINEIMTLIQEFASEWSLVGGRFDDGSMIENADASKERIRVIIAANEIAIARESIDVAANFVDPLDWPLARRIRLIDAESIVKGIVI